MVRLQDSLVSTASRPIPLRMRADLTIRKHFYSDRPYWVIKEPIGQRYIRLRDEEFTLLTLLDGQATLESLKEQLNLRFAPRKTSLVELQRFISMLHQSGLIVSDQTGQGLQLWKRASQSRRRRLLKKLISVYAIQWRGVDLDRFFSWLAPRTNWFFSKWGVVAGLLFALSAMLLLVVHSQSFLDRLPALHEFFGPGNWFYLAICLGFSKILHEFGHGLSCKRYGGECHEVGFMLLVFTPALYCNVSDSWLLPSKWQRAAIGLAGIYVEIVLASVATYLWWFSEPGLLNFLCLNTMFICSVSTIVFNGNPLLRFDGYFVLADLVEIPNLRQKSTEALSRLFLVQGLGMTLRSDPLVPSRRRLFLIAFALASFVYRWLIVLGIALLLFQVLNPLGLKLIAQILAAIAFVGLVASPIWQLVKIFRVPGRLRELRLRRVALCLIFLVGLPLAILLYPLPYYVHGTFVVDSAVAETVYVDVAGVLDAVYVTEGQPVEPGTRIADLRNRDLDAEVRNLQGKYESLRIELSMLEKQKHEDAEAARQIPLVAISLKAVEEELALRRTEQDSLQLITSRNGVITRYGDRHVDTGDTSHLPQWDRWPLDPKNLGARMERGAALCKVVSSDNYVAKLFVSEDEIEFLQVGQNVKLLLEAHPHHTIESTLSEVSARKVTDLPESVSVHFGGEIETKTGVDGEMIPHAVYYRASSPIPNGELELLLGMRGHAKVLVGRLALGQRILQYVRRTFHFEIN